MIGIIAAMKEELESLLPRMTGVEKTVISGVEYAEGELEGRRVVAAVCGVGKVFAALCAQTMILRFAPERIVNLGVGGTMCPGLGVLDTAISDGVLQYDMDTSAVGDPVGLISGINIITLPADEKMAALLADCVAKRGGKALRGVIASGDRFVASAEEKERIRSFFPEVIAVEMEGGGVGQVCYVNRVPFALLRTISDGDGGSMDYFAFKLRACEASIAVLLDFLKRADEL